MSEYIEFGSNILEIKKEGKYESLIITALKDLVKTALEEGFNKRCNFIRNNVGYIKKIEEAKNPEGYIRYIAKKLFPDAETFHEKSNKIRDRFKDKEAFACKIIAVYSLYYDALKEGLPVHRKISADEAENILAELLQ